MLFSSYSTRFERINFMNGKLNSFNLNLTCTIFEVFPYTQFLKQISKSKFCCYAKS